MTMRISEGCFCDLADGGHPYARVELEDFRGISEAKLELTGTTVLLGDNKPGKSRFLYAVELFLGADRLFGRRVIDGYDFYGGRYLDKEIVVEAVIVDLDDDFQS